MFPVTEANNAQAVPDKGMGQGGGVPDGMPTNTTSDANSEEAARYQEQLLKLQQDMNRLRSTYDRNLAEREKQWSQRQADLERQLHERATQGMDEKDRAAYERDLYAQRVQEYEQRLAQIEAQRQAEENMRQYAQAYQQAFGVNPADLDMSSPETFTQSAWQAVVNRMTAMQQELETLKGNPQPQNNLPPSRPASNRTVVTNSGAVPSAKPTFNDYRVRLAQMKGIPADQITDNDVFEAYEKRGFDLSGLL